MADNLKNFFTKFTDLIKKTDRKKIIIIIAALVLIIAAGIIGAVLVNRVKYTVLYSSLSSVESVKIMAKLAELGINAKTDGDDTILVPEEQADDLRMQLAALGYPQTGLNYDLFSNSSAIGTTDLEQQTYLQYQLQENMRTTINRMSKVKDCLVIVNLASASSYVITDNTSEARVAVLLNLEGDQELTSQEARTIGQFVLKCVPKLTLENISIVDSKMNYYNILDENSENSDITYTDTMQELTEKLKQTLKDQVLNVLEPAIGRGNVAVSINLGLNFDKKRINSLEYGPPIEGEDKGMISSSEESYETTSSSSRTTRGQTGTDQTNVTDFSTNTEDTEISESRTNTYNYELNQIETQIEKAQGSIERLSVAVLVNSNIEGIASYVNTIQNLVVNAIGVSSDSISVELMPFATNKGIINFGEHNFDDYFNRNQTTIEGLTKYKFITTCIISLTIIIIAVLTISFLARRRKLLYSAEAESELDEEQGALVTEGTEADAYNEEEQRRLNTEKLIAELKNVRSEEIERIEDLIEQSPDIVVQTLRTWLSEDK
jgi:flagellar M-ring protein FliF